MMMNSGILVPYSHLLKMFDFERVDRLMAGSRCMTIFFMTSTTMNSGILVPYASLLKMFDFAKVKGGSSQVKWS